jgi:predicted permease
MLHRLLDSLDRLLNGAQTNREIQDELELHIEERTADLIRRGVGAGKARRQARLELGAAAAKTEECREARGLLWIDEARRNSLFALRQLQRNPVFAASAVLTLGLCIGANTAIFSAADAVLLRSLPFPHPERLGLLEIHLRSGDLEDYRDAHTGRTWKTIRDHAAAVEAAVFRSHSSGRNLAVGDRAEFVSQQRVGAGFFRVLGCPPEWGREFNAEEDRPGGPPVAILSNPLAVHLFGAAAHAVGRSIRLKGETHVVVGVARPGFVAAEPADIWTPLRPSESGEGAGANYQVLVRAKGERSLADAELETASLLGEIFDLTALEASAGRHITARLRLVPLREGLSRDQKKPLSALLAIGAAVLLIGCMNIAGVLIARLQARSRELALRQSLGGGRAAVVRQMLTESLVLGLCGGIAGAALGFVSLRALRELLREGFSVWQPLELDSRALIVTTVVSIGCTLLFGFYPAWRGSRSDLRGVLNHGGRTTAGLRAGRMRRLFVVGQSAACLLVLAGAGLMIRSLGELRGLEPGFDPRGVVVADVSLDDARYASAESSSRLFATVLSHIREQPGVDAAGVAQTLPYERAVNTGFHIIGDESSATRPTDVIYVAGDYFEALRVPILRGRRLEGLDREDTEPVVLVNRSFSDTYLKGRDPLQIHLSLQGAPRRIVGIVGDVQHRPGWGGGGPLSTTPTVYLPAAQMEDAALALQNTWSTPSFAVRSEQPVEAVAETIKYAVTSIDPLLPFAEVRTMEGVQGQALAQPRVQATLVSLLAVLALALSAVGIYGLTASLAAERTREAAIRIALGAEPWQTARAVVLSGLILSMTGAGIGLLFVPLVGRAISSMTWGVTAVDPAALAAAILVLGVAAAIASAAPVSRLMRIQPMSLLRKE